MSPDSSPTAPDERIVALDALRGFAIFGILVINVWLFAMPEGTLLNPTIYGEFSGANYWAWLGSHVLFQGKFITLFTFLFGGGIVLFLAGGKDVRFHRRRMLWLAVFGAAHAYLLWYGDILFSYAVCALVVVALRDRPTRTLVAVGLVVYAVPSVLEIVAGFTAGAAAIGDAWQPAEAALRAEIEAYRGGWLAQMDHRAPTSFRRQTSGLVGYTGWRVVGAMLLGMALFKSGVMTNDRSAGFYRRLIAVGAVAGLGIVLGGVAYIEANDWNAGAGLFWRQFNYWGSLPLATAYLGAVMLYCRGRRNGRVTRTLSAVGRTAFSNYILQTVLATTIFYGHGLGLFGRVSRVELLGVVVAVWVVQIVLSVAWLRRFRFGPLEWLWRVLTYGERQPIGRD